MHLPKGNPLIEDIPLPVHDIETMLTNLEADGFTGYVRLDLKGTDGIVFFSKGEIVRAIESPQEGDVKVRMPARVINLVRQRPQVPASSYVFSDQIVGVLANAFAFKPLYRDYQVKRKELKKVLDNLEQDEFSGLLRVFGPNGRVFLLMDRGSLITDRFTRRYGEVVCGADAVGELLDYVHKNGSTIQVFAEKAMEIDHQRRSVEEDLEKIRQLIVKQETGMFRAQDVVRVSEDTIRDWGLDGRSFVVEVETGEGQTFNYKCQGAKKLGAHAGIHANMLKSMGVNDGDLVNVRPLA